MIYRILSWAVFGLIVGALARYIMPGVQSMGLVMTILLGVVGAFVGGFISLILPIRAIGLTPVGLVMSVVGALVVLFVYSKLQDKKP